MDAIVEVSVAFGLGLALTCVIILASKRQGVAAAIWSVLLLGSATASWALRILLFLTVWSAFYGLRRLQRDGYISTSVETGKPWTQPEPAEGPTFRAIRASLARLTGAAVTAKDSLRENGPAMRAAVGRQAASGGRRARGLTNRILPRVSAARRWTMRSHRHFLAATTAAVVTLVAVGSLAHQLADPVARPATSSTSVDRSAGSGGFCTGLTASQCTQKQDRYEGYDEALGDYQDYLDEEAHRDDTSYGSDCVGDCYDMDNDGRTWNDVDADRDGLYETP